ncbi:hypothetical protein [Chlamydiifrater phoenicopteri]|nr:hypothetical protein [Chlamydiifrater phoenicopteri]
MHLRLFLAFLSPMLLMPGCTLIPKEYCSSKNLNFTKHVVNVLQKSPLEN